MEHIAALLLIVGCNNSLDQCRELPAPVTVFESVSECAVERPKAIASLAYPEPRLFSRCLMVDPALEDDYDQITWNVSADGSFEADIRVTAAMVASNEYPIRQRRHD